MKALLRGGSCIVGCTLTRASRRLQKRQQPPRRLPSPVTKRARDLQRALAKKTGRPYIFGRGIFTQALGRDSHCPLPQPFGPKALKVRLRGRGIFGDPSNRDAAICWARDVQKGVEQGQPLSFRLWVSCQECRTTTLREAAGSARATIRSRDAARAPRRPRPHYRGYRRRKTPSRY